ncbi:unnamed protein product [Psylliodes chrysocephalus]|uniref:WAP domain-containing protein n=1 Tax=Psylliodes chrysocephalus TaxID=3402493 RepID=A0A9P0GJE4_9CUCU|nr:unnamed protein product [Psylliodes chrysocephala]
MKLSRRFSCTNLSVIVIISFVTGVVGQEKISIAFDLDNKLDGDLPSDVKVQKTTSTPKYEQTSKQSSKVLEKYVCPGNEVSRPFFALPCSINKDCSIFGKSILCCDKKCTQGVKPPKPVTTHSPTLFGFVQQTCPSEPLAEIWEIKQCITDKECEPRICCPEAIKSGENISYCRTAQPLWEKIPAPKQFVDPIRTLVGYMQCTPPPPPLLDLFPKPCETPLDCFPNLCCQEGGKRYCRPPKRSLLTLIAGIGQRIIPTDAAKEFIKRIS